MGRNQNDENVVITGRIDLDSSSIAANGTANVTITNVAPAGVGTATITSWLQLTYNGTIYYIPMWT